MKRFAFLLSSLLLTPPLVHVTIAHAQTATNAPESAESKRDALFKKAYKESEKAAIHGPAKVNFHDQATFDLPKGKEFIPTVPANLIMEAMGNETDDDRLGLIIDEGGFIKSFTLMDVLWVESGFVKDDESSKLDAQKLLEHLRKDQAHANENRKKHHLDQLFLDGWAEKPTYDVKTHRFYWSILLHSVDVPDEERTINYRIRPLGREGYLSMDMIGLQSDFEALKPIANKLADHVHYNDGKRYSDFNEKTDRVAAFGLLGLLGIFTAKKLGFLALLGIWAVKLAKPFLIAAGAAILACKRFFKRNKD